MSAVILTNNVKVDNNALGESRKSGYDERVQVVNIGPEKRVYNGIFLIVSATSIK